MTCQPCLDLERSISPNDHWRGQQTCHRSVCPPEGKPAGYVWAAMRTQSVRVKSEGHFSHVFPTEHHRVLKRVTTHDVVAPRGGGRARVSSNMLIVRQRSETQELLESLSELSKSPRSRMLGNKRRLCSMACTHTRTHRPTDRCDDRGWLRVGRLTGHAKRHGTASLASSSSSSSSKPVQSLKCVCSSVFVPTNDVVCSLSSPKRKS
jgi:hypothetical protein